MREIKFRAWFKDGKKMYIFDISHLSTAKLTGSYELMQFTGLKDKNGKEIFEGDIVKLMNEQNGVVYWEDGRWNVIGKHIAELTELFRFDKRCEVIGNKFENPELLEEKENGK